MNRFLKLIPLFVILGLTCTSVHAQTFDYTVYAGTLTSGATAVATAATLLAGILAGVVVWKKIVKYFNKAG